MKFGKQLHLRMYTPWAKHYIAYDRLKRLIERKRFVRDKILAKAKAKAELKESAVTELTPLKMSPDIEMRDMSQDSKATDSEEFDEILSDEIRNINYFFSTKIDELRTEVESLSAQFRSKRASHHTSDASSDLLNRLRRLYIQLCALKDYCKLNRTGVYKIVKKYDKVMQEKTLPEWLGAVDAEEFVTSTEPNILIDIVTSYVSRDKLMEWQRTEDLEKRDLTDNIFPAVKPLPLAVSMLLFVISFQFPPIDPGNPHANRCFSLLVLSVCLWLSNAIPYFATALLIPVLVTSLKVLRSETDHTTTMLPEDSAKYVLNHFFNHTTMLMLGGYTLSCAFSRCQFELRAAAWMQKRLGQSPKLFLLAIMFLGLFLSTWISNHTSPILCVTMLLPLIRDLPQDSQYAKALLLGLAFACNFGGMMTPISSMHNALAVNNLEKAGIFISFSHWLTISIPFASICVLGTWAFLCVVLDPNDVKAIPIVVYKREDKLSKRNITVLALSLVTLAMFASFEMLKSTFGDVGLIALAFVALMFGSGMLSELDFNSLSWHTLFLLGGGNVLGKAIESSGLLVSISQTVTEAIPKDSAYVALLCILVFAMTIATFVSHTVASIIVFPIITSVGVDLGCPEVMVIGSALAVSAAMSLPFSSFPNVNSAMVVDDFQRPYLSTTDFIRTGLPLSVATAFFIATFGYYLITSASKFIGTDVESV